MTGSPESQLPGPDGHEKTRIGIDSCLVSCDGKIQAVGNRSPDRNFTRALFGVAEAQKHWQQQILGYIVKKHSPDMERVRICHQDQPRRGGVGPCTQALMRNFPTLPVEKVGRLGDPLSCESFVRRVLVNRRWQALLADDFDWAGLTDFHARHQLILYSPDQELRRKPQRKLSQAQQASKTIAPTTYNRIATN